MSLEPPSLSNLTPQQEEALFQALLRQLPTVADKAHLIDGATMALRLVLRHSAERALLEQALAMIAAIAADIRVGTNPSVERAEIRRAAQRCVQVLQAARAGRLPRPQQQWATAEPTAAAPAPVRKKSRRCLWCWGLGALAVVGGILAVLTHDRAPPPASQSLELARQMEDAAQAGSGLPNPFGGTLVVDRVQGKLRVIAEGVPADACVTASWELARKGLVTINGKTPTRPSAVRLSAICRDTEAETEGATLEWLPKESR